MTKAIWKYEITPSDELVIDMPIGAQIIHVGTQRGVPHMWVIVDTTALVAPRKFRVHPTGETLPIGVNRHVGTFMVANDALVMHLFEESVLNA